MHNLAGRPPRVFISYTHDSEAHSARVLELANQLRSDGIDCDVDQYHMSVPEGWPTWMTRQIHDSEFVLVVCTQPYFERVSGRSAVGVGLGAKWEGAIISQQIYEAEGRNEKFVPIVFSKSDLAYRPSFLSPTTYYDLGDAAGYESLYRRLTSQPKIVPPELGKIRPMTSGTAQLDPATTSAVDTTNLVLIYGGKGDLIIFESHEIRVREAIELVLSPINAPDAALLRDLRKDSHKQIAIAYGSTALLARVTSVEELVQSGEAKWHLKAIEADTDYGSGFMEMGTSTHSADDIAVMRARRILLDEPLSATPFGNRGEMDRMFMDVLIRGHSTPIRASKSPFPALYLTLRSNPPLFLAVARLVGVMWLRLSGVVEHIHRLNLTLRDGDQLSVDFEGRRARKYTNEEPLVITVAGDCDLGAHIDE